MFEHVSHHDIRPWYVTGGRTVVSPYNSCDLGGVGPPFFLPLESLQQAASPLTAVSPTH
ncbi:MAG: hypothetical protein AAGI69_10480 [Cyanobacteria bacterium P01_H01_bin.21]